MKSDNHKFGCHVSTAGGVSKAFERAVEIGCDSIQIFSKNQKQWKPKSFESVEIDRYREEHERTGIAPVMIHDSYLINLCAANSGILKKSIDAFSDEISRADLLQVDYLNFHPGAHTGKGDDWGIKTIADSLNQVIAKFPKSKVKLLLETTAGQGTGVGYRFQHLRDIIDLVEHSDRMGVCVDTAHIFAAGYDIRTKKTYSDTMKELDDIIGFKNVFGFHINDSKKELGTRVDRHENLGDGFIGLKAFELFVNDERLTGKPMLLETPGGDKFYKKNIKILRDLVKR